MPIEDFPPCDKRFNSEETDKENTTRALGKEIKVIFADKDKSRSCSEKTPWTREKDSPEVTLEDKDRSQKTPWMLEKDSPGGSGYETIHTTAEVLSQHTHIQDSSSSVEISAAAVLGKL